MHLALNFQRVEPARGGTETYVALLCRHLVEAGHRVDLYAERWSDQCLPPGVNLVPVSAPGRNRLERIWSFARNSEAALSRTPHDCSVGFTGTWAHDVIIPQGGVHQGSLLGNAKRFPSPALRRLYLLAKMANPKYWFYRSIERKQYEPARQARVVAVSNMVRRHLREFHRVPDYRVRVVYNAIDPERLRVAQPGALRCAFRNRLGLEPGDLVGLFAAHNFALKGLRPLLRALGERRRRGGDTRPIHLLVCGSGSPGPYRRLATKLGINEQIHFLGFYPDITACFWSSDFFVQPTYYDPCALVVLEALACGLPVITTAQNGASELLTEGRHGHTLTAPDARGELIAALDSMADDAARHSMSVHALALGQEHTFQAHVARLTGIFQEVVAAKARHPAHHGKHGFTTVAPHFGRSRKSRR
jgi:UDP-glucose:(heptosyl)LPS alpha-1,3-glucosyltransferase